MTPQAPWYHRNWGEYAIVWWLSLATELGLYAYARPDNVAWLITPAAGGSIIGIGLIAMHFYARRADRMSRNSQPPTKSTRRRRRSGRKS